MLLGGAKHQRFLARVDLAEQDLHPLAFTALDLDDAVELSLGVAAADLHLAFHHRASGV